MRPRFQRFAVRTSKKMEEFSDIAAQKKKELAEQMKDVSRNFEVGFWDIIELSAFPLCFGSFVVQYYALHIAEALLNLLGRWVLH
ncbi:hypothetical protein Sango_2010100 [Sesamum angolense]|uniref:Uncharacterized protein n=1 Tax=Sesamum angolense TaxID=2727404 RepID=A0AAE1WFF8_9LAMI|nr:hypothetical protein Sango_2010100 [Sesamum angolense]